MPPLSFPTSHRIAGLAFLLALGPALSASAGPWRPIPLSENAPVTSLAVAPSRPATVYISIDGLGIARSDDRGLTWSVPSGPTGGYDDFFGPISLGSVDALEVAPSDPDLVFAGTYPGSIHRTTDGGLTWETFSVGPEIWGVRDFVIHPTDPDKVLVALPGQDGGVFRSTDRGETWSPAGAIPGVYGARSLAAHPEDPDYLLVGCDDGVSRSTDGGKTWSTGSNPGIGMSTISWGGAGPYSVYASVPDGYERAVWRSDDLGVTFLHYDSPPGAYVSVNSIAAHPVDPMRAIVVGTTAWDICYWSREKYWSTMDGGVTWNLDLDDTDIWSRATVVEFDPADPRHVVAGAYGRLHRGFRYSSDGGKTWELRISGLRSFRFDIAGGDSWGANYGRMYDRFFASPQDVPVWNAFPEDPPSPTTHIDFSTIGVSSTVPGLIFESGSGTQCDVGFSFFNMSTSGGATWSPGFGEPEGFSNPVGRIFSSATGEIVYVVFGYSSWDPMALSRSDSGGQGFSYASLPFVYEPEVGPPWIVRAAPIVEIAIDPQDGHRLFLGAFDGVWLSQDGGETWVARRSGLPVDADLCGFFMSPDNPNLLRCLLSDGRGYESTDGGLFWSPVFDLEMEPYEVNATAWDPATGHVFCATNGGGVFSSHPDYTDIGLPTGRIETLHFSPAQNTLMAGTYVAGALYQVLGSEVASPSIGEAGHLGLSVFPNPAPGSPELRFALPKAGTVRLSIHDTQGRLVRSLLDAVTPRGSRSVRWDGTDDGGHRVAAGVYFVRLEAGGQAETGKVILLR